jgi:hypothetical protein
MTASEIRPMPPSTLERLVVNGPAGALETDVNDPGLPRRGIAVIAINSNDFAAYPADAPDRMREEAERGAYRFPYLVDEDQRVARAYDAACTPDFFLYDRALRLAYRGQFDASRPGNGVPVTGDDLRAACEAVLRGEAPEPEQRPSLGCNIKWKAGNQPGWWDSGVSPV